MIKRRETGAGTVTQVVERGPEFKTPVLTEREREREREKGLIGQILKSGNGPTIMPVLELPGTMTHLSKSELRCKIGLVPLPQRSFGKCKLSRSARLMSSTDENVAFAVFHIQKESSASLLATNTYLT
jgi:hypothetical protein